MWVLVVMFTYNSPAITTIPGYYTTRELCAEAGEVFKQDHDKIFQFAEYSCIPAPDGTFE